ncbi:hypothetical protein HOLleu_41173 [Holothuria leucospilota]|uniref:Reverse transcriptase domain-containing protein n=1 Tax=Holothuria leucospilota TaxID=206669 RepID=A0A9Q0YB75_HOLLE|nr:hypothetical protein HOLleu_41173 [Holothuria leucospilota]
MFFADDTQLYFSCKNLSDWLFIPERCIDCIHTWMAENRLVLNASKTEVVHFYSKFRKRSNFFSNFRVGTSHVKPVPGVRNLGVYFDELSSMSNHVSKTCQSASYSLYCIGNHNLLDCTNTERLIHAFVTSHLDYCNSLLYGKHMVICSKKHEHITNILINLHWLPVSARIECKCFTIAYKILSGTAPLYLSSQVRCPSSLVTSHIANRTRKRSRQLVETRLIPGSFIQRTSGARSFAYFVPNPWNSLPNDIRNVPTFTTFKSLLKTYLFLKCFQI